AWPVRAAPVRQRRALYTETQWEVYPQGLTDTLLWVKQRYGDLPVYVTENGAAFFDPPTVAGDQLEDPLRLAYLREHVRAIRELQSHLNLVCRLLLEKKTNLCRT